MPTKNEPKLLSDVLASVKLGDDLVAMVEQLRASQARLWKEEGRTEPLPTRPIQPTIRAKEADPVKPKTRESRGDIEAKKAPVLGKDATGSKARVVPAKVVSSSSKDLADLGAATTPSREPRKKFLGGPGELKLPYWPDDRRGISNDMARCALFTVRQKEPREQFKGRHIASLKNLEILYTGEELRQRDEDVFLQILHFGRLITLGDQIRFSGADMLRALGWSKGPKSRSDLSDSITRMKANALHLVARSETRERSYSGSLIRDATTDRRLGTREIIWSVSFDPRIIKLFSHTEYTQIDWNQRCRLTPIAKWLHAYYFTHQFPFPMKVETIRNLCGSTAGNLSGFRYSLRGALAELVKVGFLLTWDIDKVRDTVSVVRIQPIKQVIEHNPA